MIVSLNILRQYIDLPEDDKILADLLTFAGIEVESIKHIPALPESVITAKVVHAEPVPKTDHLSYCKIDIGKAEYHTKDEDGFIQVICGAPNCHSNMTAILALPGTKLSDFTISEAKIRGIVSHGMLCSEKELGISDHHAGIVELPSDVELGISVNSLYQLPDTIFELEITPNRSDLLGYLGIARDLSAKLNRELIQPMLDDFEEANGSLKLRLVNEETELCPRYTARLIEGVTIAESPLWLKTFLIKSGLRPKNNIVDITNFVLMEAGHPLHAFDYDKLMPANDSQGYPDIIIRKATSQEEFVALDGKKYNLDPDELLIADGKQASALAGVMGGEYSSITQETKNIVLECASFHAGSIRKTSYKHKISTDSSYRFERHITPSYAHTVSSRATQLILEIAGGKVSGMLHDSFETEKKDVILGIRPSRFTELIGFELSGDEIKDYMGRLGFEFLQYGSYKAGVISDIKEVYCHHMEEIKQGITEFSELPDCVHTLYFKVPPFRVDVTREADIIEELARLAGYDRVPQKTSPQVIMDRHAYRIRKDICSWLVSYGCFETLNYSFADPQQMQRLGLELDKQEMIKLVNPQSSNFSVMRTTLVPQLLTNLAYNLNHGERDVRLFELGKVYLKQSDKFVEPHQAVAVFTGKNNPEHWQAKSNDIDFYWVKGCFESILERLNVLCTVTHAPQNYFVQHESRMYQVGSKTVGAFGRIKPQVLEAWEIDTTNLKQDVWIVEFDLEEIAEITRHQVIRYVPISRYPSVVRDLSFLCSDSISYQELVECIQSIDPALVSFVEAFDEYRSKQMAEGVRSLSLHITLQDQEKTLTDERIDKLMDSVIKTLQEKYQINMR